MFICSSICKAQPVGVLLGGSGIYGSVTQRAPQVSALLHSSQDWKAISCATPVTQVTSLAEANHDD